ncbi:hypothetical protein N7462_009803 [Penicillium macrosclerotiorum]|uniref:uncharacterized protein n=1 Tax=Penicillium macrosclerotiorum TaxID=303699 RepID=UPI002546DE47|nr:uncharacterized protein N7462_009803 [Penicillium macrosclerotiorum]KAJ5668733.1 hypothetical protein N7462_009803 [Penicillium macrosclerotiorum]
MEKFNRLQLLLEDDMGLFTLDAKMNERLIGSSPTGGVDPHTQRQMSSQVPMSTQETTSTAVEAAAPGVSATCSTLVVDDKLSTAFCPGRALAQFPFRFLSSIPDISRQIASHFFDGGKFWCRTWDLYYLEIPASISERKLLLIPALQAKAFFDEINAALNCSLSLMGKNQEGLVIYFDSNDGTPVPKFLGVSKDRNTKDELENSIPAPTFRGHGWIQTCEEEILDAFQKKVTVAVSAASRKKGYRTQKKQTAQKYENEINLVRGLYQLQAYFGLRPPLEGNCYLRDQSPPVITSEPPGWEFQHMPYFISVDVEWNEKNANQVTEVGLSLLDTYDLQGIAPGPRGENWIKHIRSFHLRVTEYQHHVNSDYVAGCPSKFLFGESQFVDDDDLGINTDQLCLFPWEYKEPRAALIPLDQRPFRKAVVVGHDPHRDLEVLYSRSIVFERLTRPGGQFLLEVMNTQKLFQRLRCDVSPRSLGAMLNELNIQADYLHNAGNDARYALEGLIGISLEAAGAKVEGEERTK